jgi:hypothetical protein
MNIFASDFHIILCFIFMVFPIYTIIEIIIPNWFERSLWFNILSIILSFFYQIINSCYYLYHLKTIIDDFHFYSEGFYDKYLK